MTCIDLLASEYNWSKREILENVYPEEIYEYETRIQRRKILQYKTELAISQNPHVKEPKQLWQLLDKLERQTWRDHKYVDNEKPDKQGIARLKARMRKESKVIKAK